MARPNERGGYPGRAGGQRAGAAPGFPFTLSRIEHWLHERTATEGRVTKQIVRDFAKGTFTTTLTAKVVRMLHTHLLTNRSCRLGVTSCTVGTCALSTLPAAISRES